jgi:hypothetical protein
VYLDSYKLIGLRSVLVLIVIGCTTAALSFLVNTAAALFLELDRTIDARYVAPLLEESLKAAYLVYLLRTNKIGFMVDAAIAGFAIGAGFALLENLFYLWMLPGPGMFLWMIRGFGTAIMHGGVTAIVGILGQSAMERRGTFGLMCIVPGLALAVFVHSVFNHFFLTPELTTVIVLCVLPPLVVIVFNRSERSTQNWLGIGFDTDRELLEMITGGVLAETRVGRYLHSLADRFPGEVVADMLCYLRLYLELSVGAKGILMMREAGFHIAPDLEIPEKFRELKYLERSIGKTGKLAVLPFLRTGSRDLWQLHMLQDR